MKISFDVFILQLNLLSAIVLLTISCGLFIKKDNVKANIFLGFLLLYPAISILLNIVFIVLHKHQLLFLAPMNISFNLTFGPILLTYLHFIQGKTNKAPGSDFFHFIPALLVLISSLYYMIIPTEKQSALLNDILLGNNSYINLINIFLLIHIGCYLYIALEQVKTYEKGALELEIPVAKNSIKWQKSLLNGIITINILLLLAYSLPILFTGKAHIYSDLIVTPVSALLIYVFMIYKGLTYHTIYNKSDYAAFTDIANPLNNFIAELKENNYQTTYKKEFVLDTKDHLNCLFDEKKIFTRPGLKLHDVAEILKISPAMLSFIINKHLKMTFFEMVSRYRVEEAKQLLTRVDYQHYKIEYIGEISGFNSRTSFFSVFKKQVGKTPQAFREEHL